ncbi:MAG: hypothetical protein NT105_14865 [Verrucomicrobia bacterium]|nr:hypothetical protein [Verrucomicrobiota bacterium]
MPNAPSAQFDTRTEHSLAADAWGTSLEGQLKTAINRNDSRPSIAPGGREPPALGRFAVGAGARRMERMRTGCRLAPPL